MEFLDTLVKVAQAGSVTLLVIATWAFATGRVVPRWVLDESAKREAALWVLYEREKATTDRLLTRALQQDHPTP